MQRKQIETFRGTYCEIGSAIGIKYAKRGKEFSDRNIESGIIAAQRRIYERHYPKFLDYTKGIAKGGHYDEEQVFYELACKWTGTYKGCTIFGVPNGLVGRNHDWLPIAAEVFGIFKFMHSESIPFIAIGDRGVQDDGTSNPEYRNYFPDDAINRSGLFIGPTFAYHKNNEAMSKKVQGLKPVIVIQLIAETCKTVREVLERFKEIPVAFPKNFFIADKNGAMAVVEHTGGTSYEVVSPTDGVLIKTNHFLHKDLRSEDTWKRDKPNHTTVLRHDKVRKELDAIKGTMRFEDVEKILCDQSSVVCQNDGKTKTTWSLTLDMANGQYELRYDLFNEMGMKRMRLPLE